MGDSPENTYYSSGSSRLSHSRQSSSSDGQNILPQLLLPLPCEAHFQPFFGPCENENAQNISVQFMRSCAGQDTTQLDSDILTRRHHIDEDVPRPIAYPESSQRTTSHALSPYMNDTSRFGIFSPCNLATVDPPLHGTQTFRRCSWPSHPQMGYSTWMQSPPRMLRSPASEPPETTSDESYQDSDPEEASYMSPMMNQFQIQSSRSIDFSPHQTYRAQALQPSVMTFQLSETMLQPVDDPENRHMLRSLLDMNIVADDGSNVMRPPSGSSSTIPASSPVLGGATPQGTSMRLQHDSEKVTRRNRHRVPSSSFDATPFPSPHSPPKPHAGDPRPPGVKPQKRSKMHECQQCGKQFPRPSGLATHMNTHSGAKPYKCIVANCDKRFAVRSNAKRHLRTHGINPAAPDVLAMPRYTVGFEEPMVTQVHDAGKQPLRYRWIPQSQLPHESEWVSQESPSVTLASGSATGLTFQNSMSGTSSTTRSNGSDDDYDEAGSSGVRRQHWNEYNRGFSNYPNYGARCR